MNISNKRPMDLGAVLDDNSKYMYTICTFCRNVPRYQV